MNNSNDIRDIKPPFEIFSAGDWLGPAIAVLVVLAILFFAWRLWKKSRSAAPVVPLIPAHIRAREALQKALDLISQPKSFCVVVSDTIRLYLEERFTFRAPERTTEEFLRELGETNLLTTEQKESLGRFLESCDLVKFAKYEPGENELRELHSSAVRLVDETEPAENSNDRPAVKPRPEQTTNSPS